ncbi:MAG: hypothetical protein ACRC10_00870 [Thermoguttaceae bacterium]
MAVYRMSGGYGGGNRLGAYRSSGTVVRNQSTTSQNAAYRRGGQGCWSSVGQSRTSANQSASRGTRGYAASQYRASSNRYVR